jgi:hypothetical protein
MSALTKPGLTSPNTDAGANVEPVNLEQCKTITRNKKPNYVTSPGAAAADKFNIVFHLLGTDGQVKQIEWLYSDEATRDTDYTAAVGVFATALP